MNETCFTGDLHFLAVAMMKFGIEISHIAVLTFICRNTGVEIADLVESTGMSKSRAYRVLDYLRDRGSVYWCYRKDDDRQAVKVWMLTEAGKRTVSEMERWYRGYQLRCIRHAKVSAGKEI